MVEWSCYHDPLRLRLCFDDLSPRETTPPRQRLACVPTLHSSSQPFRAPPGARLPTRRRLPSGKTPDGSRAPGGARLLRPTHRAHRTLPPCRRRPCPPSLPVLLPGFPLCLPPSALSLFPVPPSILPQRLTPLSFLSPLLPSIGRPLPRLPALPLLLPCSPLPLDLCFCLVPFFVRP